MKRVLVILPGGTTLGAYHVPHIEALVAAEAAGEFKIVAWVGGSVGTVNGMMAASGRAAELRPIWRDVGQTGTRWFQRLNTTGGFIPVPWKGVFTLDPLRAKLRAFRVGRTGYAVPMFAGLVSARSKQYVSVNLKESSLQDADDAAVCSCQQPGIHKPERYRGRFFWDAGVRNVIPAIPAEAPTFDEVVVICPSPIEEEHRFAQHEEHEVADGFEQAQAAIQTMMGEVVLGDIQARIVEARARGARRIVFFAPKTWGDVGKPFVATEATIALRFASAEADVAAGPRFALDL